MPEPTTLALLDSVWGEKQKNINQKLEEFGIADLDFAQAPLVTFTHEDIEYLCNYRYPFLQIANSETSFPKEYSLQFLLLPNKWVIYDYGNALSTAVSHFYRANPNQNDDEDASGGEGGFGTIIMQQFSAAYAMIREAIAKGWPAIEILNGTKLMQSYAWIATQELGIDLVDYFPNSDDYRRYKLIAREKEIISQLEMQKQQQS